MPPYQEPSNQWITTNTPSGTPPTVPARGIKRNNPSECMRSHDNNQQLSDCWVSKIIKMKQEHDC